MEQEVKVKKPTKIKGAATGKNEGVKQCKEAGGIVHDDNEAGDKRCLRK